MIIFITAIVQSYGYQCTEKGIGKTNPDSKVNEAYMGPIWDRQGPGGPMLAPWTLLSGDPFETAKHNKARTVPNILGMYLYDKWCIHSFIAFM